MKTDEALQVLVIGLIDSILARAGDKDQSCESIGLTIQISEDKCHIFRFDPKTWEWGIQQIKSESVTNNTILYYFGNKADAVTHSALTGDRFLGNDEDLFIEET